MADVSALTLRASAERSMSVTFNSASDADTLTFAALAALLPASAIKTFLTETRGDVPLTLRAIASNGVVVSCVSPVATQPVPQISADKTFAGFDAGNDIVLRIALASTISA